MNKRLEIEAELRGLMEEIVGDPRSSARLVPRRALREWFDGGEAIRARSLDGTRAERHLVAAHREALAAMLLEAARIAYWKAPVFSLRPLDAEGRPFDERAAEERWRPIARRRAERAGEPGEAVQLLHACLTEIPAARGHELAQASLALAPSDGGRYFVTRTLPWDRPRTAIGLLQRLASTPHRDLRRATFSSLGARACAIGRYQEALKSYQAACSLDAGDSGNRVCVFNLCCLLGQAETAVQVSHELDQLARGVHHARSEIMPQLRKWWTCLTPQDKAQHRQTATRIVATVGDFGRHLCMAIDS